jgi:long-chain fatty acid transport protein
MVPKLIKLLIRTILLSSLLVGIAEANSGPAQTGLFALADSAITAATNPAGLSRIESSEWVGQLLLFYSDSTFEKSPDESSGAIKTDSDGSLVAPFIYYARPVNDKWTFGASVTAIGFGEDVGGEGPGRYILDEWASFIASFSPAIAYQVNDRLSLGAALNINYTYYSFESAIFNGPGNPDGRLEYEADDVSLSPQLGVLYEFSDRTRVGFNWTGEDKASLYDTPKVTNGGSVSVTEIKVSTVTPQSVGLGVWHEFNGGSSFTLDTIWAEFSEFGLSDVYVDGSEIVTQDQEFEDIWVFTAGYQMPINASWTAKAGLLYSTQFIDDVNRTQKLKLDQIFGIGIGGEYQWPSGKVLGMNLNYYDLGDAPVQLDIPGFGSFSGQYTKHHSIGLDVTFRWRSLN